jgi:hypothetical protein
MFKSDLGNVRPTGHMWPASYFCSILDGYFDVENMKKPYLL